jgi:hypothetical protein
MVRRNQEHGEMTKTEKESLQKRKYPDFYERLVPIAIGVMAVMIVGLLIFALGVAAGLIQGV